MNDESTFAIEPNGNSFGSPGYEPPSIFSKVGLSLEKITVGSRKEIQDFVWDEFEPKEYVTNGVIGIAPLVLFFFLSWLTTLLVLRCLGRDRVGCAAGAAFHHDNNEEVLAEDPEEQKYSEVSDSSMDCDKIDSESVNEKTNEADGLMMTKDGKKNKKNDIGFVDEETSLADDPDINCCKTCCCCAFDSKRVSSRKFQTRFVFTLFANVMVLCCMLMIVCWYGPMKSAASTCKKVVELTKIIRSEMKTAFGTFSQGSKKLDQVMFAEPLSYAVICPNVPTSSFESLVGIEIKKVFNDYGYQVPDIITFLTTAAVSTQAIKVFADANDKIITIAGYSWIFNCFISFMILITLSQLGALFYAVHKEGTPKNTKRKSCCQFECWYGWTILPCQFILVICFMLSIIVFYFGVTLTTDFCLPKLSTSGNGALITSGRGTPEDTILHFANVGAEDALFMSYLTGCQTDPTAQILEAQELVQKNLGNLDLFSSQDDFETLSERCGPDNQLKEYVDYITVIRDQYIKMGDGLVLSNAALSCARVNTAYKLTMHQALCTDFATANANGFVLSIVISFCGMILITLRAAWRTSV